MSKSLLIVESPTKAKTLGRYLGKKFVVKASVGHVKDLPKNKLGIDLEKDFHPEYQIIRGKKKIINELHEAASNADAVYLGPDPDREGEAIAWHIAEEIRDADRPIYRVMFYELTEKAIQKALASPNELNQSLYEAQQARRILDRLVGYLISPILWQKVKRGLSAGRVQSVALRLICEREKEIQEFDPEEYWTIEGRFMPMGVSSQDAAGPGIIKAALWRHRRKSLKISSGEEARRIVELLQTRECRVVKVERKKRHRNPAPPFITSTLQQEAARRLRFSAKQTMSVAQRLYEGLEIGNEGAVGLITYMRTDSTRLSDDAVKAVRAFIRETWDGDYLPARAAVYRTREGAQDAHEAIRPTDVRRTPEVVSAFLTREQLKLYTLIWKRFVACQMAPAVLNQTTIDIGAGDYQFRATGSVIEFPGFMKLYVESSENGEADHGAEGLLPDVAENEELSVVEIVPSQHFTQPPPRYSEAALIKELEEQGIGRPSTYATILSTIVEREYVELKKQRLYPTELGRLIDGLMVEHFPNVVDVKFTAQMEKSLDEIGRGEHAYLELLKDFYGHFSTTLEAAQLNMLNLKGVGLPTELECPRCGRPLNIRWSRNGSFLACSGYPDCRFSADYERDEKGRIHVVTDKSTGETCEKCGQPMVLKKGRFGTFLACSGYPECRNTRAPRTGVPCPREGCDGELVERIGKTGRHFYGCNRYPECRTVFWGKPVPGECPRCGSKVFLEKQSRRFGTKRVCVNPSCKYEEKEGSGQDSENTED